MATKAEITALINSNLADFSDILPSKHRDVELKLLDEILIPYEVKELDCPISFINDNFDSTGLGILLMKGWAICNGQNGTRQRAGRVSVGYGTGYTSIGFLGGSKDAVVVAHTHTVNANPSSISGSGFLAFERADTVGSIQTASTGESGIDKNMQPYIVTLFIQRIA